MTEGERETGAEGETGSPDAGKLSMTADEKREGGRRASFGLARELFKRGKFTKSVRKLREGKRGGGGLDWLDGD